jgi:hypothetical protein
MIPWAKKLPINGSIRFHGVQSYLNDNLITHVKFYRQWLLKGVFLKLKMQKIFKNLWTPKDSYMGAQPGWKKEDL